MLVANDVFKRHLLLLQSMVESHKARMSALDNAIASTKRSYTTLADTKEFIRQNRPRTLTMDEALASVKRS